MTPSQVYSGHVARLPDETDEELRIRVKKFQLKKTSVTKLKYFLWKLGIKSAKSPTGITRTFAGHTIRVPGVYSNVKTIS